MVVFGCDECSETRWGILPRTVSNATADIAPPIGIEVMGPMGYPPGLSALRRLDWDRIRTRVLVVNGLGHDENRFPWKILDQTNKEDAGGRPATRRHPLPAVDRQAR